MHTYGTQTMYCFIFMCFPVDQGQVVALQLFMTWWGASADISRSCHVDPSRASMTSLMFKRVKIWVLPTVRFYICSGWWDTQSQSFFSRLGKGWKGSQRLNHIDSICSESRRFSHRRTYVSNVCWDDSNLTAQQVAFQTEQLADSCLRCKIGPWFKYLNVSNLWSAKYMVSVPWSDCFRRTMYKGRDSACSSSLMQYLQLQDVAGMLLSKPRGPVRDQAAESTKLIQISNQWFPFNAWSSSECLQV